MTVIYLGPWREMTDPNRRDGIQRQYDRELAKEHALWHAEGRVIGECDANDDVLVALPDGRYAIVHLTWSSNPGGARWPDTTLYPSAEAVTEEIAKQNADYV